MLTLVFVVVALTAIALHYGLVERSRRRLRAGSARPLTDERFAGWFGAKGVYLQPAFTWSRISGDGDLLVGIHPLLLGLAGDEARIDVPVSSRRVRRGDPLVRMRMGGREVTLPSPAAGAIREVRASSANGPVAADAGSGDGAWACRLRPDDLGRDMRGWFEGGDALRWTDERYNEIREYLMRAGAGGEVGVSLADGGEIPDGILLELSDGDWGAFRQRFLSFM